MTDSAYSLLLFAGLAAGPASAFIVDLGTLPLYLVFPLLGLFTPARRGMLRILPLSAAPLFVLVWGLLSGNAAAADRSLRWIAAVVTGASMSGALGASRASGLLFSLSKRFDPAGLTGSLAMVVSLAGPFSSRIKEAFIESRKNGLGLTDSFNAALSSVDRLEAGAPEEAQARNTLSAVSAALAWMLLLAGIMEVL